MGTYWRSWLMKFDKDSLYIHYPGDGTGYLQCFWKGEPVSRAKVFGSRQCFVIEDKYFIKAEIAYEQSQTKNEIYALSYIYDYDKKYFLEILACCDFGGEVHWAAYPFYKFERVSGFYPYSGNVARCNEIVTRLSLKYGIYDIMGSINHNWFIYNGDPLIVDVGITKKRYGG